MATTNLSAYDFDGVPDGSKMRVAIIVSEWNRNVTERLLEGAVETLQRHGVAADNIKVYRVPGSFELTFGAQQAAKYGDVDAVIILGCVIRGETPHFEYVCQGVTEGITRLNATQDIPVIFGLLTTENMAQAEDRAGGKLGNKGDECAVTAIKLFDFICILKK
ncbi:MAG: 6,7-dimethyl-8-ribityllumazine synthase [Tannerella sp.]|jgi:6,7-dimethyl-8-ribityllumazine synthase|nr:6,7-dimethyl-8-ribityllumazine synthase [Tannerella sp.]